MHECATHVSGAPWHAIVRPQALWLTSEMSSLDDLLFFPGPAPPEGVGRIGVAAADDGRRSNFDDEDNDDCIMPRKPGQRRPFTEEQRRIAGMRLAFGRARSKFAKRSASHTAAVEKLMGLVRRGVTKKGVDACVQRSRFDTHIDILVRKQKQRKAGRPLSFSWQGMMQLAHGRRHSVVSTADAYCTSRTTVRRIREIVAYAELEWQGHFFIEAGRRISAAKQSSPIAFAGARIAWDETAELVSLPAVSGATRFQQASSWQVCVCHLNFFWGNEQGAQFMECIVPPLPLLSNSASHLHAGLLDHPLMKPMQQFRAFLMQMAPMFFMWFEADAHPANNVMQAAWRLRDEASCGVQSFGGLVQCMNHQTNLALVGAADLIGVSTISAMHSAVRFFKMSGHYLRLVASVRSFVYEAHGSNIVWVRRPSMEQVHRAKLYAMELVSFLVETYETEGGDVAKQRYETQVTECFAETLLGPSWAMDGKLVPFVLATNESHSVSLASVFVSCVGVMCWAPAPRCVGWVGVGLWIWASRVLGGGGMPSPSQRNAGVSMSVASRAGHLRHWQVPALLRLAREGRCSFGRGIVAEDALRAGLGQMDEVDSMQPVLHDVEHLRGPQELVGQGLRRIQVGRTAEAAANRDDAGLSASLAGAAAAAA